MNAHPQRTFQSHLRHLLRTAGCAEAIAYWCEHHGPVRPGDVEKAGQLADDLARSGGLAPWNAVARAMTS